MICKKRHSQAKQSCEIADDLRSTSLNGFGVDRTGSYSKEDRNSLGCVVVQSGFLATCCTYKEIV